MRVGIDLIENKRLINKINDQLFLDRIFTQKEQEHINLMHNDEAKLERLAGKFCAKEAFVKMLGIGIDKGIKWVDIEILPTELNKPTITLYGMAKKFVEEQNLVGIDISISHTKDYATAICVAN